MKETNLTMTIGSFNKEEFDNLLNYHLINGWKISNPDQKPVEINYGDNLPKFLHILLEKSYGFDIEGLKIK